MNRVLKYAWYQLIVIIAATIFAVVTLFIAANIGRVKSLALLSLFACLHLFIFTG